MKCPNCGFTTEREVLFCPSCGNRVIPEPQTEIPAEPSAPVEIEEIEFSNPIIGDTPEPEFSESIIGDVTEPEFSDTIIGDVTEPEFSDDVIGGETAPEFADPIAQIAGTEEATPMASPLPVKPVKEKKPLDVFGLIKKIVAIIGILCSIIPIYFGIEALDCKDVKKATCNESTIGGSTTYTSYSYYGGDAYTGMQHASADASNNAAVAAENVQVANNYLDSILDSQNNTAETMSKLFGFVLISFGAVSVCYFGVKFFETSK